MEARVVAADEVRAFFEAHPHPNVLKPLAHPEKKRFIALFDGTEVVATATLQRRPLGLDQLGGVLVCPDRRGQGLAHGLMTAVLDESRRSGAHWIVCGVYRRDPDVSPTYRALGFRTWVPFIPGAATPVAGSLSRLLARVFRVEAGPDTIRIMARSIGRA